MAPVAGLLIEAVMCAAIVAWYVHKRRQAGKPVPSRTVWTLYGILVGGTLVLLPIATGPLSRFLS